MRPLKYVRQRTLAFATPDKVFGKQENFVIGMKLPIIVPVA